MAWPWRHWEKPLMVAAFHGPFSWHGCWNDLVERRVRTESESTRATEQGYWGRIRIVTMLKRVKLTIAPCRTRCRSRSRLPKTLWHSHPTEGVHEASLARLWCCGCSVWSDGLGGHWYQDGSKISPWRQGKRLFKKPDTIYLSALAKPNTSVVSLPQSVLVWIGIPGI